MQHLPPEPCDPPTVAPPKPSDALSSVTPPKCYGPQPIALTRRHPMVFMEYQNEDHGIHVWRCPVCARFLLSWEEG
jgi:hypothetical protein